MIDSHQERVFNSSRAVRDAKAAFDKITHENWKEWNSDLEWKYNHTLRVTVLCSQLLAETNSIFCGTGGEETLLGAAIFHDLGRFEQFSPDKNESEKIKLWRKSGHGLVGANMLRDVVIPRFPHIFSEGQWAMIEALVKRHDASFISANTRREEGTRCDRNAFLLFASLLRDADIIDNCLNLYGRTWWERIKCCGFSSFDVTRAEISDEMYKDFETGFGHGKANPDDFTTALVASVFNGRNAKTLGDALLCLIGLSTRLCFSPSRRILQEGDFIGKIEKNISLDGRTWKAFEFLRDFVE